MRSLFLFLTLISVLLLQAQQVELVVQRGHGNKVSDIDVSPDGNLLASAGEDGRVLVWDIRSGMEMLTIETGKSAVWAVQFTPDGMALLVGCGMNNLLDKKQAGLVRMYSLPDGKLVHIFKEIQSRGKIREHTMDVMDLELNEEQKLLATVSWDQSLIVWDLTTMAYVGQVGPLEGVGSSVAYSSDGKYIAVGDGEGNIYLVNMVTGESMTDDAHQMTISALEFTPDDKYLLVGDQEGFFRAIDMNTLHSSDAVEVPVSDVHDIAISDDGKLIALGGGSAYSEADEETEHLTIWELTDEGKLEKVRVCGVEEEIRSLAFSKDGKYLYAGDAAGVIHHFETGTGLEVRQLKGNVLPIFGSTGADGKFLHFYGFNKNILKWDLSENQVVSELKFGEDPALFPEFFDFDPNQEFMVAGSQYSDYSYLLEVFDYASGKKTDEFKTEESDEASISADGEYIVWMNTDTSITIRNLAIKKNTSEVSVFEKEENFFNYMKAVECFPQSKLVACGIHNHTVRIFDLKTGKLVKELNPGDRFGWKKLETSFFGMDKYSSSEQQVNCLAVSPDEKYLATGSWGKKQNLAVYDYRTGELLYVLDAHKDQVTSITFIENGKEILTGSLNGTVSRWSAADGKLLQQYDGHQGKILSVAADADKKQVVTVSEDFTLRYWDLESGKLIAILVTMENGEYLVYTPEKYYTGSRYGALGVAFRVGMRAYPFEQFDLKFNRPDLVLVALGVTDTRLIEAYKKAYLTRLKKMGYDREDLSGNLEVPEIKILNREAVPPSTKQEQVILRVDAWHQGMPLSRLNIWVNDVPMFGSSGMNVPERQSESVDIKILLTSGVNKIQISGMNEQGIESMKETMVVRQTAPAKKPDLWVVSIGVAQYSQPDHNLKYAGKDAEDLGQMMKGGSMYEHVHVITLTDEEVTREKVLEIRNELMQTDVNDYVVLSFSGHGLLDQDLEFWFATYDIDFKNPGQRGIRFGEMEHLLDGIPARRKVLLIDACHSGEVDEQAEGEEAQVIIEDGEVKFTATKSGSGESPKMGLQNSFLLMQELFTDLRRGSGATVISSSSGVEFSLEGEKWENGVFTYAILKGLSEKEADLDGDGAIMVSELRQYVAAQVNLLTKGQQTPTTRRENIAFDFRIW